MFNNYVEEVGRITRTHKRFLSFVAVLFGLMLILASLSYAENVSLGFGECVDILNETNDTIHVCAPAFPLINDTVNVTCGETYYNPMYELTVNTTPNNCTIVQNVTVMNVTNVTGPCPTGVVESIIGFNETKSWANVSSIIVHGPIAPFSCPECTATTYCSNTSVSRQLGYEEYFHVNEPGCFVELFGPPLPNTTCICPTLPSIDCPTCPKCPTNTVTKEVVVDSCPKPDPSTNCSVSIKVGDKMYCQDSLEAWTQFQVNASIFSMQQSLSDCQKGKDACEAANTYIKSNTEMVNTVLILGILCLMGMLTFIIWNKLRRGGGPVAEGRPMLPSAPVEIIPQGPPVYVKQGNGKTKGVKRHG